ncbi:hypothetical protein Pelo_5372 [Pelomyxa schiedti]|nr:hypothetical protein Pelo_5372 [Pelomyxa schiedti]
MTRSTICDKLQHSKADALCGGDPALTSSLIGTIDAHTKLHLSECQYQDHKYAKARNFPGLCKNLTSFYPSPLPGRAKNRFCYKKLYLTFDNAAVNKFIPHSYTVECWWLSSGNIPCMHLPFLLFLSCADVPTSKSHSLFVLDVVWDWQDYFSPCLRNVKWQHIEDCFGFKISVGVPTGGDAAHESVVIRTSFPLHLIDRPAVFPGSFQSC